LIVSIKQLSFKTIIGILDHERITPQRVIVDCDIEYDYSSDTDFINYALVAELIQKTMHKEKFELIETALLILIQEIKKKFSISHSIALSIAKPDIVDNCQVSVSLKKSFL
jgi:dihydroneopterin aldolase